MIHVRLPYRIILTLGTFGMLALLGGCGRDASQSDVDALREEVDQLKQAQAQMQTTLASLASAGAAGEAGGMSFDAADERPKREAVRRIPVNYAPRKGPEVAAVTVIEFADFQCPFCQANAGLSNQLLKQFPNDVQFAFKHYPLGRHPQATIAARASWAAHQQDKFWAMHDTIYANDIQQLSPEVLRGYAEKIGLDMAKYDADFASEKSGQAVGYDKMLGKGLKVGGTPTYFVNGKRVRDPSAASVMARVQEEIDLFRRRAPQ